MLQQIPTKTSYQKPKLEFHTAWITLTAAPFSTGPIGPGGLWLPEMNDFLEFEENHE